jgi:ABC-type multidrug transport system ATPase subunit
LTLSVVGLSKRLGRRDVLKGATFSAEGGRVVVLFGANGTGKSTLLGILAGALDADAGEASLAGETLLGAADASTRARVGYVPEAADPPPHLSPRELLALVAALKRAPPLPEPVLTRLGLPEFMDRPVGSLSLGQRRRACLAAALVGDARLLLLDEPTNGLDAAGVIELRDLLRAHADSGGIALVATHDAPFADAVGDVRLRLSGGCVLT